MKYIKLVIALLFIVSLAKTQTTKKAVGSKTPTPAPINNLVKAPFLKRNFLLDPAIFPESNMAKNSEGAMQLNIKTSGVKSGAISIIDGGNSSVNEMTKALEKAYEQFRNTPDASGYTFEKVYINNAGLTYGSEYIKPLEYKMVYHGTRDQRELAKAMEKMPKPRKLNEKPGSSQPVNQYDTDENNRIIRFYLLNYSPGVDIGFMFLSNSANYADDKKNEGAKLLQKLLDGITPMKINEQIDFIAYKDSKYMIDIALPASTKFEIGMYSFPTGMQGNLTLGIIKDAAAGYATKLESFNVNYGTIVKKSTIEKLKLYNGISIYSCTFTIQKKEDNYMAEWFEVVSILVPDNKIIKKPMQITLMCYSTDPVERNSLNAFILNSISMPGTLNKSAIGKVKETYKK